MRFVVVDSIAKRFHFILVLGLFLAAPCPADADDFLSVYQQAAATSPVLARARSLLEADRATLPLARSGLLPHVKAGGGVGGESLSMKGFGEDFGLPLPKLDEDFTTSFYTVSLTQPIVNGQAWVQVRAADARIRAGQSAVLAAQQDLILQVGEAYFGLLRAQAEERVARNQRQLLETILNQTEAFLRVGSGDVIAVEEARAALDGAEATLIRAENTTRISRQRLERLTHQPVGILVDLDKLTPEGPHPNAIAPWLERARENQPLLQQAREQLNVALDQVEVERRARWPKLNLDAGYSHDKGSFLPSLESNRARVGVNLSIPLYTGGEISAKTGKARAEAQAVQYQLMDLEDRVALNTENAFLILQNSVEELRAAEQAVTSSTTSLQATRKGYEIGSRSVVDLLKVAHDFEAAERNYFLALYNQVLARLRLKAAAGILSEADVLAVNALLQKG